MDNNIDALKNLYVALGGDANDVKGCSTIVEVLNVISEKYEGATDAIINPDAINNIAAVADNIGGGGGGSSDYTTCALTVSNDSQARIFVANIITMGENNILLPLVVGESASVVLYKEAAIVMIYGDGLETITIATEGNIAKEDDSTYIITGDASMTITANQ